VLINILTHRHPKAKHKVVSESRWYSTVTYLMLLAAGFLLRKAKFGLMALYVGCVADNVALGQDTSVIPCIFSFH